jgi:NADH-quinone oxidoreductase subunit J
MMNASTVIFYLLAALTLGSALLSVTSRSIFRAAIFLLFSLMGVAGIYFWLQYEFIAAVQIVVYVGGITVLIIFSIFLTQQPGERMPVQKASSLLFSFLAALLGFIFMALQLNQYGFSVSQAGSEMTSVKGIGSAMLEVGEAGYALPFELISILLLAAMIGCIVIAMRPVKKNESSQ